jgi:LPS-assembly lipoprotein
MAVRSLLIVLLTATLAACGFHLRGSAGSDLPYASMYIALPETAEVRVWLERYLRGSTNTAVSDDAKTATVTFQQLSDGRDKSILSIDARGRVREYRLQMRYRFRLVDAQGREIVAPQEISMNRDMTYDDSQVLSKSMEENLLWRDMTNDLVNQIMRRLSRIKPKDPSVEDDD